MQPAFSRDILINVNERLGSEYEQLKILSPREITV